MNWFKSTLAVTALGLAAALAQPASATTVLKLGHINKEDPFDNPTGAMAEVFKNLVESGTNGSVQVQVFPNGQLGKDGEMLAQEQAGVTQAGIHSSGGIAAAYPMIGVLDVPFAFPNISVTYKVFDGPFGKKLSDDIQKKTGLKVLGISDSGGFYAFTNSKHQIHSPADMKGLKIRTMGLDTHKALIKSMGGQPVAIAWAEVYTALQTGVADGQMNPIPVITFGKLDEVQKYLTLTGHLFTPYVFVINNKFYEGLTPQERHVVDYAARSAVVAGRGIARIIEASDHGLPALAKKMDVYTPTVEEKEEFRKAAQPAVEKVIAEKYGKEGTEMMKAFLAAIDQVSKEQD